MTTFLVENICSHYSRGREVCQGGGDVLLHHLDVPDACLQERDSHGNVASLRIEPLHVELSVQCEPPDAPTPGLLLQAGEDETAQSLPAIVSGHPP